MDAALKSESSRFQAVHNKLRLIINSKSDRVRCSALFAPLLQGAVVVVAAAIRYQAIKGDMNVMKCAGVARLICYYQTFCKLAQENYNTKAMDTVKLSTKEWNCVVCFNQPTYQRGNNAVDQVQKDAEKDAERHAEKDVHYQTDKA
uniref:Uncharacterized protein n=1 Tax=Glossina pallidipes TaxID=7398 RepID=A0A1A9ZNB4_GLOPL